MQTTHKMLTGYTQKHGYEVLTTMSEWKLPVASDNNCIKS